MRHRLIISLFLFTSLTADGRTWYVTDGANGDGSSWISPLGTITESIGLALFGDEIRVHAGTYREVLEITKPITLMGGFTGFEPNPDFRDLKNNPSIINGETLNSHLIRCIHNATIDGFSLVNGKGSSGGALVIENGWAEVRNCVITDSKGYNGGGVLCFNTPTIFRNCTFRSNSGLLGGGLYCSRSNITLINCLIVENQCFEGGGVGGGIYMLNSSPSFINCTIASNSAPVGHGLYSYSSNPTIRNSIIHNLGQQEITSAGGSTYSISYSCIKGGYPGVGNLDVNPEFQQTSNSDYLLLPQSLCVDSGDPSGQMEDGCLPPGLGGPRNDIGCYGGPGNCNWLRPYPSHTGSGTPTSTMSRTLTHTPSPSFTSTLIPTPNPRQVDFSISGIVDTMDLFEISKHWGEIATGTTEKIVGDVDANGGCDASDLLFLLRYWKQKTGTRPEIEYVDSNLVTVEEGGIVELPNGALAEFPPGVVETDREVELASFAVENSSSSTSILASVEVRSGTVEGSILGASYTLRLPLKELRLPGTQIDLFILRYESEFDSSIGPEEDRPIYMQIGFATVDPSGLFAEAQVPLLNERYVLREEALTLEGLRKQIDEVDKGTEREAGLYLEHQSGYANAINVLLIHGNHSDEHPQDKEHWEPFIQYIRNNHSIRFNLYTFIWQGGANNLGISDHADKLASAIMGGNGDYTGGALTNSSKHFMILAHSAGGLVARAFIVNHDQGKRVDRLITLATPHHGSPGAIPLWMRFSLHGGYEDVQVTDCDFLGNQTTYTYTYRRAKTRGSGEEYWFLFGHGNPIRVFWDDEKTNRDLSWNDFDTKIPTSTVYKYEEGNLISISDGKRTWSPSSIQTPISYTLSPSSLDEKGHETRNDFLQELMTKDASYRDKYYVYGGYDSNLADQPSFANAFFGKVLDFGVSTYFKIERTAYGLKLKPAPKESGEVVELIGTITDHVGLAYFIGRMGDIIGSQASYPYRANDGMVPLSSALYLDDQAPTIDLNTIPSYPSVGGKNDLPGFQGHRYRLYPNHDHLAMVVGDQPNSTLFKDIVSDLQDPVGGISGALRIMLTWGRYPTDLDSHLTGPAPDGSRFHLYYGNRGVCAGWCGVVDLDTDDTTSYGPENTRIEQHFNGTYRFSVHHYCCSGSSLATSNARVRVFRNEQQVADFGVPSYATGRVWNVFEMDGVTGEIIPLNTVDGSYDSLIGGAVKQETIVFPPKGENHFSDW